MSNYHLKIRRDTSANWSANNPTPVSGEICYETDTKKLKIGDGVTAYNSLTYFTLPAATSSSAGLMSAADKAKLNGITISLYAKINSPAFTGTPTAPSIATPYNVGSDQLATLDHVQQAIANSRSVPTIAAIFSVGSSGTYTIIDSSVLPLVTSISVNGEAVRISQDVSLASGNNVVEINFRDYSTPLYRHRIPDNAFAELAYLEYAVLSPDIVEIGSNAFYNSGLSNIYCPGAVAPRLGTDAFAATPLAGGLEAYVPAAASGDYGNKWTFGCTIVNL